MLIITTNESLTSQSNVEAMHHISEIKIPATGLESVYQLQDRALSTTAFEAFLIVDIAGEILSFRQMLEAAGERGILENQFRHDCELLSDVGLFFQGHSYSVNQEFSERVYSSLSEEQLAEIREWLTGYILYRLANGDVCANWALADLLATTDSRKATEVFAYILRNAYENVDKERFISLFHAAEISLAKIESSRELLSGYETRLSADLYISTEKLLMTEISRLNSAQLLSHLELLHAAFETHERRGDFAEALTIAKKALMEGEGSDPALTVRANLGIGRQMTGMGRIDEGQAYFDIAHEQAKKSGDFGGRIRAALLSAITQYLAGNLSRSQATAEAALSTALFWNQHYYSVYARFVLARIDYELGRYEKVLKLCEEAMMICELHRIPAPVPALYALHIRASIQHGRHAGLVNRIRRIDRAIDKRVLAGEYNIRFDANAKLEDAPGSSEPGKGKGCSSWNGMFAPIEGRARIHTAANITAAYSVYLTCRNGRIPKNANELSEIVREENMNPFDALNSVYCLSYSLYVAQNNASEVERVTVLSRAVKYMQRRAAEIDDAAVRREFLDNNAWNKVIHEHAIASKLI